MAVSDPHAGTILVLQRTQPSVRLASFIGFLLSAVMAGVGFDLLILAAGFALL